MTDERNSTPENDPGEGNSVSNKLDSLLPVPEESDGDAHTHGQVDGPIDELLPKPGRPDESSDDASTREELEVDTTADDIDDFIPLRDQEKSSNIEDASTEQPEKTGRNSSNAEPTVSEPCPVCGATVDDSRFCPDCGTEQIPASRFVAKLAPLFMWSRALSIRMTLSIGAVLTLVALLADSGALALIITASVVPVVLLIRLSEELGGQSKNGWVQVGMMVLIGTAVGLPIAWLSTRMVIRSWFEGGIINFGATNFGGIAVQTVGNAPLLVWLTSGILLPLVIILAVGAAPGALRMALAMPLKARTGMMLSSAVAAGYLIGSAAVFFWPLFSEPAPVMSTSEWTLTIIGISIVRPVVWVFFGALTGAVVWQYLRRTPLASLAFPGAVAICIPLGYSILSLAVAPSGLWTSTLVGVVFAIAAVYFHMRFIEAIKKYDSAFG